MTGVLTKMKELTIIVSVGKTEAGNAEVQPARDSQLRATNSRRDGSLKPAIPFDRLKKLFRALQCLKKPDKKAPPKAASLFAEGKKSLLTIKWTCPIHAEPLQDDERHTCFLWNQTRFENIFRFCRDVI